MRVKYTGLNSGNFKIDPYKHNFTLILQQKYNVEIVNSNPDIHFIYLDMGKNGSSAIPGAVNILYDWDQADRVSEVQSIPMPDYSSYDGIIGHHTSLSVKYSQKFIYYPLWVAAVSFSDTDTRPNYYMANNSLPIANFFAKYNHKLNNDVTCMIHGHSPVRNDALSGMSERFDVKNGVGHPNKLQYISASKFHLAFENHPDHPSEKLTQPLSAGIVPIYWANDGVFKYINKERLIHLEEDLSNIDNVVAEIKELYDDNKFLEKVNQPVFVDDKFPEEFTNQSMLEQIERLL